MKANPITNRVKDKFKSLVQEPLLNVGKVEGGKSDCGCGAKSPAKQTASQTATFGPDGTDPNPKLFAGIVKNAKKAPAKQTNKKVLKAAKRGAKAKAKSEFKYAQANAKFDKAEGNISRKESRARIRHSRQDFRDAKREIKDYVDY